MGNNLTVKEFEFCGTNIGLFALKPMSKQSKQETNKDNDNAPNSNTESLLQPMDLYGNDDNGNKTVESNKGHCF